VRGRGYVRRGGWEYEREEDGCVKEEDGCEKEEDGCVRRRKMGV